MRLGRVSGPSNCRILIEFDLSAHSYGQNGIPPGAIVEAATLTLNCTSAALSGAACTLYLLKSGVRVDPAVQTWNAQDASTNWLTGGGDFIRDGGVSFALPIVTGAFDIEDIEDLVQLALDENAGYCALMLKKDSESGSSVAATFSRCNDSDDDLHPALAVTYSPTAASTTTTTDPPDDETAVAGLSGDILWGADQIGTSVVTFSDAPGDP